MKKDWLEVAADVTIVLGSIAAVLMLLFIHAHGGF